MENKEVEKVKELLDRMIYDEDFAYSYEVGDIRLIAKIFNQLGKEKAELEQQLKVKDKALDEELDRISKLKGFDKWKEMLKHGTE